MDKTIKTHLHVQIVHPIVKFAIIKIGVLPAPKDTTLRLISVPDKTAVGNSIRHMIGGGTNGTRKIIGIVGMYNMIVRSTA